MLKDADFKMLVDSFLPRSRKSHCLGYSYHHLIGTWLHSPHALEAEEVEA